MAEGTNICLVEVPCILYRCLRDPIVPGRVKLLVVLLLAYILSPIDLVPDFIPVLGLLDEVIVIPFVLRKIIRQLPPEQLAEYSRDCATVRNRWMALLGIVIIIGIWGFVLNLLFLCWQLL